MYLHRLKSIFLKDSPFTIQEGAQALSLSSSQQTAKILSRLAQQGHLKRIKRGVYLPVSHKALTPEEAYADPWSILPVVFPQGYIGGWSAANFCAALFCCLLGTEASTTVLIFSSKLLRMLIT